jgi:hypothetical protein
VSERLVFKVKKAPKRRHNLKIVRSKCPKPKKEPSPPSDMLQPTLL